MLFLKNKQPIASSPPDRTNPRLMARQGEESETINARPSREHIHPTAFGNRYNIISTITVASEDGSQSHPKSPISPVSPVSPMTVLTTSSSTEAIKQRIKGSAANFVRLMRRTGRGFAKGRHESDISKEIQRKENAIDPAMVSPRRGSAPPEFHDPLSPPPFQKRRFMA